MLTPLRAVDKAEKRSSPESLRVRGFAVMSHVRTEEIDIIPAMQSHGLGGEPVPDVSLRQKAATELVKRIRKLRWIGMDDEADTVRAELASQGMVPADSVLAVPCDTD
jgi:hypothetical protein